MLEAGIKYKWLLISHLILLCSLAICARTVEVEITGIRSEKGQIIIEIYKDQYSFKNEQPFQKKTFKKCKIEEGMMKVEIILEEGIYGFALVDDENSNGEMDYRMKRLTKEGFAFSDFYLNGFKRPVFDDFKFSVEKDQTQRVVMKIRYM